MTKKHSLTILISALALLSLSGCGARKMSNLGVQENSSRLSTEDALTDEKPVAVCNLIEESFMSASSMVYIDDQNDARNEAMRLKISSLSDSFEDDENYFIQLYRWKADSGQAAVLDPEALEMGFELTQGRYRLSGTTTTLNWMTLQEVAAAAGMQGQGLSYILSRINLIINLKDPTAQYDAIKIVAYRQKTATTIEKLGTTDSLIPAFYADPKDYAKDEKGQDRSGSLLYLHPFVDLLQDDQMSADQISKRADGLCWESIF